MNLQVQPLKVLATRQVVRNRLDFTSYLNGTVRDELERLDRLERLVLVPVPVCNALRQDSASCLSMAKKA